MAILRRDLGHFLRRFTFFEFDLREQVRAARCAQHLRERWDLFMQVCDDASNLRVTENAICEHLRSSPQDHSRYVMTDNTFDSLPIIDKNKLRMDPASFCDLSHGDLWRKETSGTTGRPVPFYYSEEFHFEHLALEVRKIAFRANINIGVREVCVAALMNNPSIPATIFADPLDELGFFTRLPVDERQGYSSILNILTQLNPEVISSTPTQFGAICDEMGDKQAFGLSPQLLICCGSKLSDSLRQRLQHLFSAPVVEAYAISETGLIGSECMARNGLHVDESTIHVECVSKDGLRVAFGNEGIVVVSCIANKSMPLLRYSTGDWGVIENDVCECGRSGIRITRLTGRKISHFTFSRSERFDPTRLHFIIFKYGDVTEFNAVQSDVKRVEIQVSSQRESKALLNSLKTDVQAVLPNDIDIDVTFADHSQLKLKERYRTLVKNGDGVW